VAVQQLRGGIEQERQQDAFGFGEIKPELEGPRGGVRIAERVAGDRLQQERAHSPKRVGHRRRVVQNRREYRRRRVSVTLGEPQLRDRDADLAGFARLFVELCEQLFGALDIAHMDEHLS